MRLLIVLASGDLELLKFFERRKQGVVPRDLLAARYYADRKAEADTRTFAATHASSPTDLELFVQRASAKADAVMVLHDEAAARLVGGLQHAALLSSFAISEARGNPENVLQREIARGLRHLAALGSHMARGDAQKILLLPLRNFHAQELAGLEQLVLDHAAGSRFPEDLEQALARFRANRQRPKPAKRRRSKFLVDDRSRFFEYGLERHARVATTGGQHGIPCALNSLFRFGLRYDDERHFNVSAEEEGSPFEGEIDDCHECRAHVKRKTHLNLFPNGYYE